MNKKINQTIFFMAEVMKYEFLKNDFNHTINCFKKLITDDPEVVNFLIKTLKSHR